MPVSGANRINRVAGDGAIARRQVFSSYISTQRTQRRWERKENLFKNLCVLCASALSAFHDVFGMTPRGHGYLSPGIAGRDIYRYKPRSMRFAELTGILPEVPKWPSRTGLLARIRTFSPL